MAINYSGALVAELRMKQAAGVPYRTLAEEYGLSRGTIFGLIRGQHGIRATTAQAALSQGRQDFSTPLIVDPRYTGARVGVDPDTGLPLFHPARHADASKIGSWWRAFQDVKRSRFTDFRALEQFRGAGGSVRVVTPNGVLTIQLPSDRDRQTIIEQAAILDTAEPLDINRAGSGPRGRRRIS
jgi:hypothetical protein